MIREAAEFAERAHEGVYRKGTKIPYITHPMETAAIVTAFTNEPEMIAAALLHDVSRYMAWCFVEIYSIWYVQWCYYCF